MNLFNPAPLLALLIRFPGYPQHLLCRAWEKAIIIIQQQAVRRAERARWN